ncbi:DUF4270 domain-containing protein [Flavobacterium gelatinilyticum]|uniref:DUF4270 domain-containing protein n=1 Tax=Flavobacterium gelatinilyticum TaxID=3003260 RepID=UPI002480D0AA|nr:DUF4270 domain-containing protein [Flavobacterium gelatinilyticum]
MYNTSFIKKTLLAATVVLFCSCDKDFNAIGDDLISDDHFGLDSTYYDVVAYNQEVTPVQSNLLPINALGIYDSPVFGSTKADFVTQLSLESYAPTIGEEPEIVEVQLSVPYFSHIISSKTDGGNYNYALDSIYGPKDGRIKLSVYESNYQMRTSYPSNGTQLPQYYYTDEGSAFLANLQGDRLNNGIESENIRFFFSSDEKKNETRDAAGVVTGTTYVAPEMRLNLDKAFFETKILKAAASKLSTPDVFQEYFRGLYFKVEKADGFPNSQIGLLDFSKGKITITYKAKATSSATTKDQKTLVINFVSPASSGGTANLLTDVKETNYENAIKSPNRATGDEKLYVRGGQGSVAVIELKDFASKLQSVKDSGWKVNEANLVFHIDAQQMASKLSDGDYIKEPKRVYLYDLDNNTPLLDYSADGTASVTSDARMSKLVFGGIINLDATTKRGSTYKIRITSHIRNLIKNASAKNVRLGLVVTDNVSIATSNQLKNRFPFPGTSPVEYFSAVPRVSVMNPLGTVLYGGAASVPEANRLRLEVYYTKPNK